MDEKRVAVRTKRQKPPDEYCWDCSVCTYKNSPEAYKCEMCDVRKGTSTRKPRLNAQLVAQQVAQQYVPPPAKKERSLDGAGGSDSNDYDDSYSMGLDNDDLPNGLSFERRLIPNGMDHGSLLPQLSSPLSGLETGNTESVREGVKERVKEEVKDRVKEETKERVKEEAKERIKDHAPESKETVKCSLVTTPVTTHLPANTIKQEKNKTNTARKSNNTQRSARLKNIDRSSAQEIEVTVNNLTVVITDYQPHCERPTSTETSETLNSSLSSQVNNNHARDNLTMNNFK